MRVAVALLIPEPLRTHLSAIQTQHHLPPWEPSIDLHITLVSPFDTQETATDMTARLAPIAAAQAPFPIELGGLGRFDNEQSVLFAQVIASVPLEMLAQSLLMAVQDLRQPRTHPFTPHVTLAHLAPRPVVDDYFERLKDISVHERFIADRFALLALNDSAHRWEVLRNFVFGN